MILYFSGTGNSYYVARETAKRLGERLVSISSEMMGLKKEYNYELSPGEVVGFVFPVYAWAPPKMVTEFIEHLKFTNAKDTDAKNSYVFTAAVCGDDTGNAVSIIEKSLRKAGLGLNSAFSVRMPNNYIIFFDVDPKESEHRKLEEAKKTIDRIVQAVSAGESGLFEVHKGPVPGFKTTLIGSLFNRFALGTKSFFADENCTGCGICQKVCNCGTITVEGKPKWGSNCAQCLACVHYCPAKAIHFGKLTKNKGRYVNPNVALKEMLKR